MLCPERQHLLSFNSQPHCTPAAALLRIEPPPKIVRMPHSSCPTPHAVCSTSVLMMQQRDRPALSFGQRSLLPDASPPGVLDPEHPPPTAPPGTTGSEQQPLPAPAPKHVRVRTSKNLLRQPGGQVLGPEKQSPSACIHTRGTLPPIFRSGIVHGKRDLLSHWL